MASRAVSGTKPGKGGSVTHNEGDWICSDKGCANINFSWRTNCNKCGKEKGKVDVIKKTGSEIGTQAATRSGGLFSADDWQCSVCSNVNWARRSECNVCRTPKFNISEARTGAGGGYNEREDVQYKEREESSDDEYDEFGRKKKKFRRKTNGSKQISTTITYELEKTRSEEMDLSKFPLAPPSAGPEKKKKEAAEEEEEEEEEDGDDEDVSKYDLMAELDDEAPPTTSVTKGGSNLPSRKSRSPSPCRSRSPRPRHMSSRSQSSRSRSRSPVGVSRSREGGRRRRSRSPSPRQRRRSSRSRSRSRTRKRSRSHSRTRSPHRRRSGGSKDSGRRSSRSRSRSRDCKRRSYSRSQSRSRSRDRRRSYRSRSRSRDRDGYR